MNEQFINDLSKELAKLGTIHSVGEEWISYTGKIPSGGIPYCGQEITRETYSALWSWVQAQGLVKTESEWQSIASNQNGNVPFYSSGNGTTTFRMPKLVGYVKGASSQSESGSYVKEGLPNIVAQFNNYGSKELSNSIANGAFYLYDGGALGNQPVTSGASVSLGFDASRSNAIYGNSEHVTPETSVVLFGVYAFGTVSNPNDLNVSNLASDIDNIKTSYLPLSGGTMTGEIFCNKDFSLLRNVDNQALAIGGGTAWNRGAYLSLTGKDHATEKGVFKLSTHNGTNTVTLQGSPDGTLKWGSKEVERVNSKSTNWIRFESGLQICFWFATIPSGSKTATVSFPVAFSSEPKVTLGVLGNGTVFSYLGSTTTTRVVIGRSGSSTSGTLTVQFIAIGYWK